MGEGGGVGGEGDVGAVCGGVEGGTVNEVGHCELVEGGEVGADLFPAAAGKEGDPGLGGVEVVEGGVGLAGGCGEGELGEGVADELGVYVAVAVEGFFKGEDDQHFGDALLDPAEAATLPGPELGRDEPDNGDAGFG